MQEPVVPLIYARELEGLQPELGRPQVELEAQRT